MTYLERLTIDSQKWLSLFQSVLVYVCLLMCPIYCILTYGISRRKKAVS